MDPKVVKIVDTLKADLQKAGEVKETTVRKADAVFFQTLGKSVVTATTALKRALNDSTDVAYQAEIYKIVLSINLKDADAVRFFSAVGTLEQVLSEVRLKPLVPQIDAGDPALADPGKTVTIPGNQLRVLGGVFKLQEPFRVDGESLRFASGGGMTLDDTSTGSFTIRLVRGMLAANGDDEVAMPVDVPVFRIRGNVVLSMWQRRVCEMVGRPLVKELWITYNADGGTFAIFDEEDFMIKRGSIVPKKDSPLFQYQDTGAGVFGSRIKSLTLTPAFHRVLKQ